jgi:hypothetical protein
VKYLILALIVVISALSGWGLAYYRHCDRVAKAWAAEHAEAKRIATLIASANSAGIRDEMKKQEEDMIVRDAKWIHSVSEAVAATVISRKECCLCCGWRTAHFYRNGQQVISIAAIHGNALRIYWGDGGGGDFPVDGASWQAVKAALMLPNEANQPPLQTSGSVTPAAGAPGAPPPDAAGR